MTRPISTHIMATMADDRCTAAFVKEMADAGMDSVRINSAHVDPHSIAAMTATIRAAAPEVAILMDTKGPEIRTTSLADDVDSITLADGDRLTLVADPHATTRPGLIAIAVAGLDKYLKPGHRILIDDGAIELTVAESAGNEDGVTAIVTRGGKLGSRKTVAAPEVELPPLPAVSERDRVNIAAAIECGVSMIAHSFVRSAADVEAVRSLIAGTDITLYAKIECREAVENLDEILAAADGLLVARGDLGTQVAVERIPAIQHRIACLCRAVDKPVIVATQMLDSMERNPYPTRAEVSDIAFAVLEGIDTLLLTGETARGAYPVRCVEVMRRTIEETEAYLNNL